MNLAVPERAQGGFGLKFRGLPALLGDAGEKGRSWWRGRRGGPGGSSRGIPAGRILSQSKREGREAFSKDPLEDPE